MARRTLRAVALKALEDEKFLKALIKDPEAALEKAGMQLTPKDLKSLRLGLRTRRMQITIDPVRLIRQTRAFGPIRWPTGWLP